MDIARKLAARARAKRWAEENPERYRANQERWRRERGVKPRKAADPEVRAQKARERAKQWRRNNPEKVNIHLPEWKVANPERAKDIARAGWINRRAREKAVGKLSCEDIRSVRSRKICAECGDINPHMEIDHIVALSRGGTNHLLNLQLLCRPCNRSKWAKDLTAWRAEKNSQLTL